MRFRRNFSSLALFLLFCCGLVHATGINDSGLIVGYVGDLTVRGFLFDGTTFTSTIQHGSDSATFTIGINKCR